MKKRILQFWLLAAIGLLAGCEKENTEEPNDSVYRLPEEYHDMTADRHLKKIHTEEINYNWTGNNDTVVIPDSTVFTWEGDRLTSVRQYIYSASEFDNHVYLCQNDVLSFSYEGDRIVNIHGVSTFYSLDTAGNANPPDTWEWDEPFTYTGRYLTEMGGQKVFYNDSSDVIDIQFLWDGQWISQFRNPVWQNRNLTQVTYVNPTDDENIPYTMGYSYDNKISPYRCIPREFAIYWYLLGGNLSKNNITSKYIDNNCYATYTYEYDGDYPTTRIWESPNSKITTHYEYE